MTVREVPVAPRSLDPFASLVGEQTIAALREEAARVQAHLSRAVVWNVNSTAVGGGVAEMLGPLVAYARGLGLDVRWVVMPGDDEFFKITKRLHHLMHGEPGDGRRLDAAAREHYESVTRAACRGFVSQVRAGDVVILHDPQTVGMAPELLRAGAKVVWRCHIGTDDSNGEHRHAWEFLSPYLEGVPALVFSRRSYAPEGLDDARVRVIAPSIDAFSPKNVDLTPEQVLSIMVYAGLVAGPMPDDCSCWYDRADGSRSRLERVADVVRSGRAPSQDAPLVVQVSRWDPLKDMVGVLRGFELGVEAAIADDAHLVLAGPNVNAVADDPEGPAVFGAVAKAFWELPYPVRRRVHLAMLPTADPEENATLVNALQRHAAVVVQKSLREGFGLTVTEAMWKQRAVLASRVGGIQDQIEHGTSGILLDDPTDLQGFADALGKLVNDESLRERLGTAARARVRERFLGLRSLLDYAALLRSL